MAQLIKMKDYASRYEQHFLQQNAEFLSAKQAYWQRMKTDWMIANKSVPKAPEDEPLEKNSRMGKAVNRLKWWKHEEEEEVEINESDAYLFFKGKTLEELKDIFYDNWFLIQLEWASSTISEISMMDPKLKYDYRLRTLLRELPDTYFVMYYPVFHTKQTTMEGAITIVGPVGIDVIHILEGTMYSVFEPADSRFWKEYVNQKQHTFVSPVLALKRTMNVVEAVLKQAGTTFPVQATVVSPASIIDNREILYARTADKREYKRWMEKRITNSSPVKNRQLFSAEALMEQTATVSVLRSEIYAPGEYDE